MICSLDCRVIARALAACVTLALGPAAAGAAEPLREYVLVVDRAWQRVWLSVAVTDRKGRPVRDVGREAIRVIDNGAPVEIAEFSPAEARRDRPLSVAVLLDLSESMGRQVRDVRAAAQALLRALRPGDEIQVARFNDQLTILQPFTGVVADPERTLDRIGRAWGGTAIFRAVESTLKDLRDRPGRKIILVVSDGIDNDIDREQPVLQSRYLQDLARLAFRTETTVYGVRPGMGATSWLPFEGFVEQTGGRLLYTGGDLTGLFARLGEEFLSRYEVGYDIDPKIREGEWRRVRVEVDRPGVIVQAVQGYFTPRGHLEALRREMLDRDARVRADAAYDLGFSGDPRAGETLLEALRDPEPGVRRRAAEGLARLRDAAAVAAIVERLGDPDAGVRDAAAAALEVFGPAAIPALRDAVQAGADPARGGTLVPRAAEVLGRVGDDRAIEPLAALLRHGPVEDRVAAARALGDLGLAPGIPALRAALADTEPGVRRAALRSIAAIAGDGSRAVVEDYLRREEDPALRAAAEALLGSR